MSRKVQIEYNCESCLYKCSNKRDFNKHLLTKKHLKNVEIGINPKINSHIKYTCELCDYRCSNERDFNKHLLTKKLLKIPKLVLIRVKSYLKKIRYIPTQVGINALTVIIVVNTREIIINTCLQININA